MAHQLLLNAQGSSGFVEPGAMSDGLSKTWPLQHGKPRDLSSFIPRQYKGVVQLTIAIAQFKKEFTVYCRTQPSLDLSILDNAIAELQRDLGRGKEPAWSHFQRDFLQNPQRHSLEKRYLSGFYSYTLAGYLQANQNPESGRHFADAYGQLRPFATNLANTARFILAVKMNWFRLLETCGHASQFQGANVFFNKWPVRSKTRDGFFAPRFDSESGLWIDPFTELYLLAIFSFLCQASALSRNNPLPLGRNSR